jgi:hypothetical protein
MLAARQPCSASRHELVLLSKSSREQMNAAWRGASTGLSNVSSAH